MCQATTIKDARRALVPCHAKHAGEVFTIMIDFLIFAQAVKFLAVIRKQMPNPFVFRTLQTGGLQSSMLLCNMCVFWIIPHNLKVEWRSDFITSYVRHCSGFLVEQMMSRIDDGKIEHLESVLNISWLATADFVSSLDGVQFR